MKIKSIHFMNLKISLEKALSVQFGNAKGKFQEIIVQ